jgi:hypothetical protein
VSYEHRYMMDPERTVALYRSGRLDNHTYDLSDPLDCALFCALQRYVSRLEPVESEEEPPAGGYGRLALRLPAVLEEHLLLLRAWDRGEAEPGGEVVYWLAHAVLEALFSPPRSEAGWGRSEFTVPREFWESGEPRRGADYEPPQTGGRVAGPLSAVAYPRLYAPLARLLRRAVGSVLDLRDAAWLLDRDPRELARMVREREVGGLRIGEDFVVSEREVERQLREGQGGYRGYSIGA